MDERTIKVTGTANITGTPDWVTISFYINSSNKDYSKCMEQLGIQTDHLRSELLEAEFKKDALKTSDFSIVTDFEYVKKEKKHVFKGYKASHNLKIEFDYDKTSLNQVLGLLSSTKSQAQFRISFSIKDTEPLKEKALALAVKNSKKKALLLSEAAGVKLIDIQKIDYSWGEVHLRSTTGVFSSPAMTHDYSFDMDPDDIDISDSVTVVWGIE